MARKTQSLQLVQDATMERVAVSAVSKVGVLVPPWAILGVEAAGGALSHALWGTAPAVTWAAVGCTLGSTLLTGLTWAVTHQRRLIGRLHATATTAATTSWFTLATITGVDAPVTSGVLFYGGATLAVSWNLRTVIRMAGGDDSGHGDALSSLFERAKEQAGLKGARVRATEVTEHKVKGRMQLPPGEKTADEAIKATDRIESGMQLPPGSVIISRDEDRADRAHMTISDPRAIRKPIPWPGPSHPGGSIDKPLRIGVYQDGDDVEYRLVGQHLQIMGMTGSGKSIGGAWNFVAEIITRTDAAVFSIDVSKDDQTMGPLREGLHRFETTKAGAVDLIRAMHAAIPERTKWLAARGYQAWEPGCGLTHWYLHIEEIPKLFNDLGGEDEERLAEILKEIRSAGGSVILSLQRADFTQIPTLIRSQMAKMCFGLSDPDDVKFGVSARQRKADVEPHEWENHHPGMAYLDGKSVRSTHYAMPLRTFSWGRDSREANGAMAAHAAQWPAAAKSVDDFTAALARIPAAPAGRVPLPLPVADEVQHDDFAAGFAELLGDAAELVIRAQQASPALLQRTLRASWEDCLRVLEALERKGVVGPPAPDSDNRPVLVPADDRAASSIVEQLREDGDPVAAALRTDDPDPSITAGPDTPVQEPTAEEADHMRTSAAPEKLPPLQARALVYDWLRHRHQVGQPTFTASDDELTTVRRQTGNGRAWTYKILRDLTDRGVLTIGRSGSSTTYTITDLSPLDHDDHQRAA
ncbi:DNA translocase FtsK [Thermomonospora umbrina]|uniref:FtsK-like protein n=1 Tax=Thermomonospora umbrina TaxID=111806 RepID=A0A3D9SLA7_9ACTN|nr:DNA translocase FtsK [Thermomonospora umbrina]REE96638.1 FtsK-like protein [Thermomonospora umbrina]